MRKFISKDYQSVTEAKNGISSYMNLYNYDRPHQSLCYKTPPEVYFYTNS